MGCNIDFSQWRPAILHEIKYLVFHNYNSFLRKKIFSRNSYFLVRSVFVINMGVSCWYDLYMWYEKCHKIIYKYLLKCKGISTLYLFCAFWTVLAIWYFFLFLFNVLKINVREYRRSSTKGQSRETGNTRRRKKNKNTTQYMLNTTIHNQRQIT